MPPADSMACASFVERLAGGEYVVDDQRAFDARFQRLSSPQRLHAVLGPRRNDGGNPPTAEPTSKAMTTSRRWWARLRNRTGGRNSGWRFRCRGRSKTSGRSRIRNFSKYTSECRPDDQAESGRAGWRRTTREAQSKIHEPSKPYMAAFDCVGSEPKPPEATFSRTGAFVRGSYRLPRPPNAPRIGRESHRPALGCPSRSKPRDVSGL